jgi:hypothetical protein
VPTINSLKIKGIYLLWVTYDVSDLNMTERAHAIKSMRLYADKEFMPSDASNGAKSSVSNLNVY